MTAPQKPNLENLQNWMQSVIMHPHGIEAGLASTTARSQLDVSPAELENVIDRSAAQSSLERLGIYATAYHARLIECLEAEFPAFRQAVGTEAFADFAVEYLKRYPSNSYTLAQLGASFPKFLEETKPADRPESSAAAWPEFLVDLAQLERTFSEVFDGAGVEEQQTLSVDELQAIDSRKWPHARLTPVPCLRLLALRFALNDYYTAAKNGGTPPVPRPADSWLAITRRNYIVRRYELTRTQFVVLDCLHRGKTIGRSIAAAAETYVGDIDGLAADVRNWFQSWAAAPMFEAVVLG